MQWNWKSWAVCVVGLVLGACGGGGVGGHDTCVSRDVAASFTYGAIRGNLGRPLSLSPQIQGIPASCAGDIRFTVVAGTLPPGLTLDGRSGVLAGTPTETGAFWFDVRLTLIHFHGAIPGGQMAYIEDASARSLQGWEVVSDSVRGGDDFRLGTIGTKLYMVTRNRYANVIETYESADGTTWTLLPVNAPTPDVTRFALSSDGQHIHLSGGFDSAGSFSNAVWRFDGTAWTQMTAAAPFSPRENHTMLTHAGALYVMGGQSGRYANAVSHDDVWTSTDSGATWSQLTGSGFTPRHTFCALSHAGMLYVVGGTARGGAGTVLRSPDGNTWTPLPISPTSPLLEALRGGSASCAVRQGRMVLIASAFELTGSPLSASSADGLQWEFEPHHRELVDLSPGAVTFNGRIYVGAGLGTSGMRVLASVP